VLWRQAGYHAGCHAACMECCLNQRRPHTVLRYQLPCLLRSRLLLLPKKSQVWTLTPAEQRLASEEAHSQRFRGLALPHHPAHQLRTLHWRFHDFGLTCKCV
jgi:hypothetical protein